MTVVNTTQHSARLLTYAEAAKYLGVGYSTVRQIAARGEIPLIYVAPRTPRIDRVDLDAYIEQRKTAAS